MTGLPRLAVLGLDVASAAATISLVDGGLEVTTFACGPIPSDARAALAAYGCEDRLVGVATDTLRLATADPATPPFAIHGVRTDPPTDPGPDPTPADTAADDLLGIFDAVVLTGHTERLLPVRTGSPRFGGVFDRRVVWAFHVTDPPELATAQGRWIGEYLRGRYALPEPAAMDAATATGRPRRGGAGRAARAERDRERRAGHARAAATGYPVPRPPATGPAGVRAEAPTGPES
ncbi:hypothetical protein [Frankia sp. AgB32]|uniref:hypothetical protein n=1 Tax=Frankia sp. AgB32 TaxID=631119 RepID=UPI00200EE5A5|nr:hypothetical protein [Frankia sp. AgB32]MCK9893760.1 hypothetical protein [Frankia sp. AgB32]